MNYRLVQEENHRKTKRVILIYVITFFFLGLLAETISVLVKFNTNNNIGLIEAFKLTVSLTLDGAHIPLFTIIMTGISIILIIIVVKYGNKMMLSGSKYTKLTGKEKLNYQEEMIMNRMEELKLSSRLRYMPEVYIIEEDYLNAFASGWNEENSIVAITRGLLNRLDKEEVAAVLAHEIGHIKNADVRLTLVVGILTNVMVYAVDFLYYKVAYSGNNRSKAMKQIGLILLILKIFLPIFTFLLQMYLSRTREYLADSSSVEFTDDPEAMISALKKISDSYNDKDNEYIMDNKMRAHAYIFNVSGLFSTHPSIEDRISKIKGNKR